MENDRLFETTKPSKALVKMALPTIISQLVLLVYNLADTWFIGRTNNPYMIGASSLALTVYLAAAALANTFGVGGGTLMVRLIGQKKNEDAQKVASYTVTASAVAALVFSILVLCLMNPLLRLLGAGENTLTYGRQYLFTTTVVGSIPTVLSMSMPQLLRNAGYSKLAGIGIALGSIANILLDPLFMFVIFPDGKEVLGAGIATALANVISLVFFIIVFHKVSAKSILSLPRKLEHIDFEYKMSFYSVGIPAAISIFLFDLVTIVINRLVVGYGDIELAAMGIVLKLERIPINVGLGVCLGMVPLVGYNFGSGNHIRMKAFSTLARRVVIGFSLICAVLFWIFAEHIIGLFIHDEETIRLGTYFLRGRCFAFPFMMIGYHTVNFMNAVNKGGHSFLLAVIRHLILIIPIMLIMNALFGIDGFVWSQLVADFINAIIAWLFINNVCKNISSNNS